MASEQQNVYLLEEHDPLAIPSPHDAAILEDTLSICTNYVNLRFGVLDALMTDLDNLTGETTRLVHWNSYTPRVFDIYSEVKHPSQSMRRDFDIYDISHTLKLARKGPHIQLVLDNNDNYIPNDNLLLYLKIVNYTLVMSDDPLAFLYSLQRSLHSYLDDCPNQLNTTIYREIAFLTRDYVQESWDLYPSKPTEKGSKTDIAYQYRRGNDKLRLGRRLYVVSAMVDNHEIREVLISRPTGITKKDYKYHKSATALNLLVNDYINSVHLGQSETERIDQFEQLLQTNSEIPIKEKATLIKMILSSSNYNPEYGAQLAETVEDKELEHLARAFQDLICSIGRDIFVQSDNTRTSDAKRIIKNQTKRNGYSDIPY